MASMQDDEISKLFRIFVFFFFSTDLDSCWKKRIVFIVAQKCFFHWLNPLHSKRIVEYLRLLFDPIGTVEQWVALLPWGRSPGLRFLRIFSMAVLNYISPLVYAMPANGITSILRFARHLALASRLNLTLTKIEQVSGM